jgi:hypothetical protein
MGVSVGGKVTVARAVGLDVAVSTNVGPSVAGAAGVLEGKGVSTAVTPGVRVGSVAGLSGRLSVARRASSSRIVSGSDRPTLPRNPAHRLVNAHLFARPC